MLETNITQAANIFLWILVIGIGFTVGIVVNDFLRSQKQDKTENSD